MAPESAPDPYSESDTPVALDGTPHDNAFEAFRAKWRDGAPLDDLYPDGPFALREPVGPYKSNRQGDVAKVQSLLHDTGHLNANETDGPTGLFSRTLLEEPIRRFQKDNGLKVDGVLNPDGETIGTMRKLIGPHTARDPFDLASTTTGKSSGELPQSPRVDSGADIARKDTEFDLAQARARATREPQTSPVDTQIPGGQHDPWPDSPIGVGFRNALQSRESRAKGYAADNGGKALGRYQMTGDALEEAGMIDASGRWTGKYGIHSADQFLGNRGAQEKALADYLPKLGAQLEKNGAASHIGQKIEGIKQDFEVTPNGLYAAAHRWGARSVRQYLDFQESNGWKSDVSRFPPDQREKFLAIETRLREFQNIEMRRDAERKQEGKAP